MILTPHVLAGAAIGAHSPNIWTAFCLGLASHYILDAIPHRDYLDRFVFKKPVHRRKIAFDFVLSTGLILILTWSQPGKIFIFTGLIAAVLPDFLEALYQNFDIKFLKPLSFLHLRIHYHKDLSFWRGLPALLTICSIAIFVLILNF